MDNLKVQEIKNIIDKLEEEEYLKYIDMMSKDNRESVKKLALGLSKKLDKSRIETERLIKLFEIEEHFIEKGNTLIGGIDEAGRGPLAGPVVAACVVLEKNPMIKKINDSKKISEKVREELFEEIKNNSISYGIGIADNNEIDSLNIYGATMLAMKRAIEMCDIKPDFILIDGNQAIKEISLPQKTVIQGDARCSSIACASILAKVTRDSLMKEYAKLYTEYGFEKHKGYGTLEHVDAIRKFGVTPIHRMSFLGKILEQK